MCLRGVVPLPPKKPCLQSETDDIALPKATPICSSREQLSNSMVEIFEMQRRVKEVSDAWTPTVSFHKEEEEWNPASLLAFCVCQP